MSDFLCKQDFDQLNVQTGNWNFPTGNEDRSYRLRKQGFACLLFLCQTSAAAGTHTRHSESVYERSHTQRRRHTSWHKTPGTKRRSSAHQNSDHWRPQGLLQGDKHIVLLAINSKDNHSDCNTGNYTLSEFIKYNRSGIWPTPETCIVRPKYIYVEIQSIQFENFF